MTPPFRLLCALLLISLCSYCGLSSARAEDPGAASFSANDIPAAAGGATIVTLPAPGRYSFAAHSLSGARIELVDMIAGPIETAGATGQRDGRIDALLDKGAYKLRVFGATGATGKVRVSAQAFTELNAKRPELTPGRAQSGDLTDLQQRSYAVDVGPGGEVAIEAIGRSLADLRLWRDTGELVDIVPERRSVETKPGRSMTRLRLEGAAPPGRYIVTAYGGEAAVWPEGDKGQPLLLRIAPATPLDAGVYEGAIGPFGAERFRAPAEYTGFRLELPQPAPARLEARRGRAAPSVGLIAKTSRDAAAVATIAEDNKLPAEVEASGYEGQRFSLRAVRYETRYTFEGSGPHLVAADVVGEGGDEVPATALFARVEKDGKTRVLAQDMPRIGAGHPWRGKFNLRGLTSLLFEATDAGPVAVEASGVKLRARIEPALGALMARADGETAKSFDLAPGYYLLTLEPQDGGYGVVDVTLGPPGLAAPAPERPPQRTSISFGVQDLQKDCCYLLLGNVAPLMLFGPRVTALPAELAKAPLPLWQGADERLSVPLRLEKGGKVSAHDERGADVPFALGSESVQDGAVLVTATVLPTGRARAIGFSYEPPKAEPAAQAKEGEEPKDKAAKPPRARPLLSASGERPVFFDLDKDQTQELRLDLAQPGLYRVETLGRLKTAVKLGARVVASLGAGEDNGPGHNGLVTTFLRAGAYRASVTAKDSSGRAGFSAKKASLAETSPLKAGGTASARLAPGAGAAIPIEIADDGRYTLELLGVGRVFNARFEDAEGWPLAPPGPARRVERDLARGAYRLVVTPEDVEARLLARLRAVTPAKELSGHGPHELPFGGPQKLQWREPQAQGAPREPDLWRFALAGDADVKLAIGEGMIAEVFRDAESLGKFTAGRDFDKRLGAGDYRVEARALAADDRHDYEISLSSKQLQPGAPRFVDLPEKLDFAIARDRVVDLTSFGAKEILATLKNAGGEVVEQVAGGETDWNVALSRRLPAGAYTLELSALGSQPQTVESDKENSGEAGDRENAIEIALALPDEIDEGALDGAVPRNLHGAVAHALAAPKALLETLSIVSARASRDIALTVERRDADGVWRGLSLKRGRAPFAAWPADETTAYRVVVWPIGGGDAEIEIGARAVARVGQSGPRISLDAVEGLPAPLCAGLVSLAGASVVDIAAAPAGLVAGSLPGAPLRDARTGALAPQSDRLWLAAAGDCRGNVELKSVAWRGEDITLDLAAGEAAQLPPLPAPRGKARVWRARAESARPGLDAGLGMAPGPDATLALAGDKPLRVWNAGGNGPLRVVLEAIDLDLAPPASGGVAWRGTIPPRSAQIVTASAGEAPLRLELAPDVAAFATRAQDAALALGGGSTALSATYHGPRPAELVFVNLGSTAAPVAYAEAPGARESLSSSHALKRFFASSSEIVLPVAGEPGDRLYALGGAARFVSLNGRVSRTAEWRRAQGDDKPLPVEGRGFIVFDHEPGLAALWIEGKEKTSWPGVPPRPVTPPQRLDLAGVAQSFAFRLDAPALVSAKSDGPAIVAVTQNGQRSVEAFPDGVELARYLAAGDAQLDLFAPNAGVLSGALDLALTPVQPARDGLNDSVTLAPGEAALFGFEVKAESDIGLGLRADPDVASLRLFASDGRALGDGVAQMRRLPAGRYVVEARTQPDAPPAVVRLALLGLSPPRAGPPDDVLAELLGKAGMKQNRTR